MSERVSYDLEKLSEAIEGLGQQIALAFNPFITALTEAATEIAIAFQPLIDAFNGINLDFDWDKLELEMTLKNPERWAEESLVDWGKRLERAGLLDQLEYRWMYQKECWRAVLHSPVWAVDEAWEWVRGLWTKSQN